MTARVLIVDDSPTMRGLIAATLRADPEIDVIGQAADPNEARAAIKSLNPDVITLDIEMPNMDGLEFLDKIMRLRPTPVIMISTMTQAGTDATLRALEAGAFDCVAKPTTGNRSSFDTLADKVKAAAGSRRRMRSIRPASPGPSQLSAFRPDGRLIAIGSSTGGVEALVEILSQFPANCPATIISQHMPTGFTGSFAARLNKLCAPHVAEAVEGAPIQPGHVYLAPGNMHLEISGAVQPRCRLTEDERVNGHRPSVDVMFQAVLRCFGRKSIGVILTGMGRDGAAGLLALRQAGAETLGQDEASCVVYGMPKAAFELGAVARQVTLDRIAAQLLQMTNAAAAAK